MNNISYAILVHDEEFELNRLLIIINKYIKPNDEIVIVSDNETLEVRNIIEKYKKKHTNFIWHQRELNSDFASQKNYLFSLCSKEYIFNLDADEYPHENLLDNIHNIVELNNNIDLFWIPRINTVDEITAEDIAKWKWTISPNGWINWPYDSQARLIKNNRNIHWINKVHERLTGYTSYIHLPNEEEWAIYHPKTIHKQKIQNNFYDTIY